MKVYLLCFTVCMLSLTAIAQRTITGTVKDDEGSPVTGAAVLVKGTTLGAYTDDGGKYSLQVSQSATTLVFTYIGKKTVEEVINGRNVIDVVMAEEGVNTEEVIITALGIAKQPREVGYAVARINGEDVTQARVVKLQNGLVGKVSGLNVSTVNNGINADTRIVLRGIRSLLGNNQALLVLDGTPVDLNLINSINPNDVQSVNVLKGANAAALYGPEGVNGVIVVTTKKGSSTGKPQVSFSNTTLFETVSNFLELQETFGSGSSYNSFGDGIYDPIENQSWGPAFDGTTRPIGKETFDGQLQEVPYTYLSDEKQNFFNTGVNLQNDFSVSAGDDKSNFYLSAQNIQIKGIMPDDNGDRTTVRLNAGKTMGIFNASVNMGYTLRNDDVTWDGANVYWHVLNAPGHIPLTRYSNLNDYWSNVNNYYNDYYPNPYQTINDRRTEYRKNDVFGNVVVGVKPTDWLNITNRLGYTSVSDYSHTIERAVDYSDYAISNRSFASTGDEKATVSDYNGFTSRINNELILTTDNTFGKINVKALLGNLTRQSFAKGTSVSGANLVIPTLFNVSNRTGEPGAFSSFTEANLNSVFGSVSFGYNNYLFVEVTGRNDWDSRLPADNRSYFYPGVSGSLIITDLIPTLQSNFLNSIKLKGAYSKAGSVNLDPYSLESTFSQAGGFPYGSLAGFTANDRINNPNLRPEQVKSTELGAEIELFNNRITLDVAYYFQNNNDQVIPVSISGSTGYTSAFLNAAEFENKGFEVDLRLLPFLSTPSGFKWDVSMNYTYNDSEVKSIFEGLDELAIGNTAYVIKGYPAYVHKLVDWLRTPDGRVIIDPISGYPSQNTVSTIFGRTNPKHIVGINTDLSFKGVALKLVAEYRGGNYIYNAIGRDADFTGVTALSATNGRQRFVFPNSAYSNDGGQTYVDNTNIVVTNAHYDFLQAGRFRNTQTNYYSSAAFWKLREIALSYELPSKVLSTLKVLRRATVALVGRNLIMLRPDSNQWTDPEFSNTTGNAVGTTTLAQSPPTRIYGFNLNLTF